MVQNPYVSFEQKHRAWFNVMMRQDSQEEASLLEDITYDDIEKAQIEHFKQ